MTTLTATAIISAVDRASAVFARVGAAARAQAGKFAAATAAVNRFGNAATLGLGAPGTLAAAFAMQGEYEADKALRVMQSIGEITDEQRKMLEKSAFDNSIESAVKAIELIKGQQEFLASGLDADTAARMTATLGKVSRANAIMADQVAETGVNVANALSMPLGTVEEKVASLTKALEFMSVVPNLSTETFEGLRTSMKYAAPVAGVLGIKINELGAALGILADAGFKGEEGGTALRTVLTRALALTPKARQEIRAAGVDIDDIYKVNQKRLGDMTALKARLNQAGLGQGVNLNKALGKLDPSKFKSVYDYQDALQSRLMGALGIKKGDAESRGILQKAISSHVMASTDGFDIETYFQGISKLGPIAMKEMFGLQRVSQALKLREEINKIVTLPTGERISKFQRLAAEIERLSPGAIDRRFIPVSQGFSYFIDRTMRSVESLRNSVFNSGVGSDVTGFFESLARTVERLRNSDPTALKAATYGLAGLAALGPAALVLGGIASALGKIGGVLGSKAFLGLAAGGGIAALLFGDGIKDLFTSQDVLGRGGVDLPGQFLGEGSPILATVARLKGLFDEISGLLGDILAKIGSVATEFASLFNIDVSNTTLLTGLQAVNTVLEQAAKNVEAIRGFFKGEAPKVEAPSGDWFKDMFQSWRLAPHVLRKFLEPNSNDPVQRFNQSGQGAGGAPAAPLQVNGKVAGDATVTVKVDQDGRLQAYASPMKLNGTLDNGRASPDTPDTRPWATGPWAK
ncbi:MAG: phage tail tape measure protein [Hyphomicrobiaceae bacterium]